MTFPLTDTAACIFWAGTRSDRSDGIGTAVVIAATATAAAATAATAVVVEHTDPTRGTSIAIAAQKEESGDHPE